MCEMRDDDWLYFGTFGAYFCGAGLSSPAMVGLDGMDEWIADLSVSILEP